MNETDAMGRHSPEGVDEVLESAQREATEKPVSLAVETAKWQRPEPPTAWSDADFARHAASILIAFADNKPLEFRSLSTDWHWREYDRAVVPNVTSPALEWRIKRTPRKVWVAFHESGSIADMRATAPHPSEKPYILPGGLEARFPSDYIEFEEKLS